MLIYLTCAVSAISFAHKIKKEQKSLRVKNIFVEKRLTFKDQWRVASFPFGAFCIFFFFISPNEMNHYSPALVVIIVFIVSMGMGALLQKHWSNVWVICNEGVYRFWEKDRIINWSDISDLKYREICIITNFNFRLKFRAHGRKHQIFMLPNDLKLVQSLCLQHSKIIKIL